MTRKYVKEDSYWRDRKNKKNPKRSKIEWKFYFLYGKFPTENEFNQYKAGLIAVSEKKLDKKNKKRKIPIL